MKIHESPGRSRAFTLLELIIVVAALFVLVLLILPEAIRPHGSRMKINCENNLKQVSLAFRLWAGDNSDKYPMAYAGNTNYPLINGGNPWSAGRTIPLLQYTILAAMSNELSTPKVVVCPQDAGRTIATNFTSDFNKRHVSFFVGLDADETLPHAFLAGDRDLTNCQPAICGIFDFQTSQKVVWAKALHNKMGNIAMGDGSVQEFSNAQISGALAKTGMATNRLLFP